MKYDIIIIGGGLSGLTAGIKLAGNNKKVAIITSGQSALHFSSGSMGLLSAIDGQPVSEPLKELDRLPEGHPYRKIGLGKIGTLAAEAAQLLDRAGISMWGNAAQCHYRLTPLGMWEPTWLSNESIAACEHPTKCPWRKAAIVNLKGYLDFFPEYVADGLRKVGIQSSCHEVTLPELAHLRKSCSEMRAASIAKILHGVTLKALADEINRISGDADVVLFPAVVGLKSSAEVAELGKLVKKPIRYVPVIPMPVTGVRSELMLRNLFEKLGGTYLLGDSVTHGIMEGNRLKAVETTNLGNTLLEADNFILCTGSFFSQGLVAKPNEIVEPVFNLDVDQTAERTERYNKNFFGEQPYMRFGVTTDSDFRVSHKGSTVGNLRAAGAILSGANALKEGSGAGIAVLSALEVANRILNS